jgi:hypothetical protein
MSDAVKIVNADGEAEIGEILEDGVDDDSRVSEVTGTPAREKWEPEFTSLDRAAIMSDVAKLVRDDAILRKCTRRVAVRSARSRSAAVLFNYSRSS